MHAAQHLAGASALAVVLLGSTANAAPWDKPGWTLTFQDEFDGTSLDLSKWGRRYKWGEAVINGELQAYVDDAFTTQNGFLEIAGTQRQAQYAGQTLDYASGVICSVHEQQYGYFEASLKMPSGQGFWPAFWLLGGQGSTGVNEIDIQEFLGHQPNTVYMTLHWGPSYTTGHESDGTNYVGPDFTAGYHTFGLQWDPDAVVWFIDGTERFRHTGAGIPQTNMYIILNLAVGGGWPGAPDSTTPFPGLYDVEYVRAYARSPDAGAGGGSSSTGGSPSAGASNGGSGTSTGGAPAAGGGSGAGASSSDSSCACRVGDSRAGIPQAGFAPLAALLAAACTWLRRSRRGPKSARADRCART
jgi:beta-glucanase (GH16 family)